MQERDGPASEATKRRPHKKSLPAIPVKKKYELFSNGRGINVQLFRKERSSSLRPLEFWRDFEQKQAERKQDPKIARRSSRGEMRAIDGMTSLSSDTVLESHLAVLKSITPREQSLIDWSNELASLTEQKLALLKRESELVDREAAIMQQELILRDMAEKQQIEGATIMRQIEVRIIFT